MTNYRDLFWEENEAIFERYRLSMERIRSIKEEPEVHEDYQEYFCRTADFILKIEKLVDELFRGEHEKYDLNRLHQENMMLYEDILPTNYKSSYANPQFAVARLGEAYGAMLAMLYKEIRGMIVYAYESRLECITIFTELFVEVYNCFEADERPNAEELREILYWFFSDYSDRIIEYRIREQLDIELTFALDIIMESDLSDLRYLYRYGEYVTENELGVAKYLYSLPKEQIEKMANTFTEGFRIGFENTNKDLSKKKIVNIRYHIGFERVIREAVRNFEKMGLSPTIYRQSVTCINNRIGYEGADANKQYHYDHKNDKALYLDKAYVERRLGILKSVYDKYKKQAALFAGPACLEIFGEKPFAPKGKEACIELDEKQQVLEVKLANESGQIVNAYIPGEERSFTIIAFPVPEISDQFEEIFQEVIKINTLDYKLYEKMQQTIIDVLDEGEYVHIKGMNNNQTDLRVQLHTLRNQNRETLFENCVADVNIPVGEVFTSPRLTGTNGVLHVKRVFLNELEYRQLKITFQDGMISDYTCQNFNSEKENIKYIRENVLYHHDTLPMGEFAIGTNTTAYVMAQKYQIAEKLPILIAEKMGPHFAVGDTCYSWQEETPVYNPDGKEIIARDNEVSLNRKEDISKAYYNCHTDITIPYDELGSLEVVKKDGSSVSIVQNGRFVLAGTEPLNEPFLTGR